VTDSWTWLCRRARVGSGKVYEGVGEKFRSVEVREVHRKVVLMHLGSCANPAGEAWPSLETMAVELGLSRRSVRRAVDSLVVHGFMERQRRPNQSTTYRLNRYALEEADPLR